MDSTQKGSIHCDESLRDIYVLQTSIGDHEWWVHLVNGQYAIKWFNGLTQKEEQKINFEVVNGYLKAEHDLCSSAHVYIDKIQINNHFFVSHEIENDISPKAINSMQDHETIIKYMIDVSLHLGKPVVLTPENERETILIRVTGNKIEYLPEN